MTEACATAALNGVKVRTVDKKDFKFDIGATIGHYKNKIRSLNGGSYITNVAVATS